MSVLSQISRAFQERPWLINEISMTRKVKADVLGVNLEYADVLGVNLDLKLMASKTIVFKELKIHLRISVFFFILF